ncbi:hypothetical protein ACW2QC_07410 [Virgibacillus sp. FSP13]
MKIGRRIYYEKETGNVILDTGEKQGFIKKTTIEQDIKNYRNLTGLNRDTFDVLELEYGQHAQDFVESNGYRVNPETKTLEFSYPDPNEEEPQEPVYQEPLSITVENMKKENELLKAQNKATSERADFIEDVIAEMAMQVYQ